MDETSFIFEYSHFQKYIEVKRIAISTKLQKEDFEALDSIEKIIRYCKNPPDNFNIKMEELKAFNSVKEKVKRLIRESKKQATLDSYINI